MIEGTPKSRSTRSIRGEGVHQTPAMAPAPRRVPVPYEPLSLSSPSASSADLSQPRSTVGPDRDRCMQSHHRFPARQTSKIAARDHPSDPTPQSLCTRLGGEQWSACLPDLHLLRESLGIELQYCSPATAASRRPHTIQLNHRSSALSQSGHWPHSILPFDRLVSQ